MEVKTTELRRVIIEAIEKNFRDFTVTCKGGVDFSAFDLIFDNGKEREIFYVSIIKKDNPGI